MNAVIYVRVSTDKQDISPEVQQKKCLQQAELSDLEPFAIIKDIGKSAKDMKRDGIQRIISMVEHREVGAVIVYKLDRLTRDVSDLNNFIKLCVKQQVELISVMEALNTGTASGRMVINLLGTVSQWERETIGERTREALQHKKANGQVYSSQPPYGKKVSSDGKLIDFSEEKAAITVIKSERQKGFSFNKIAEILNAANLPTRSGKPWCWQSVQKIWKDNQVSRETA